MKELAVSQRRFFLRNDGRFILGDLPFNESSLFAGQSLLIIIHVFCLLHIARPGIILISQRLLEFADLSLVSIIMLKRKLAMKFAPISIIGQYAHSVWLGIVAGPFLILPLQPVDIPQKNTEECINNPV